MKDELARALERIQRLDGPSVAKQIARAESLLGIIAHLENDYERALKHHKRDFKASKRSQDSFEVFRACINIQVCQLAAHGHLFQAPSLQDIAFVFDEEKKEEPSSRSTAMARSLYLKALSNEKSFDELDHAAKFFEPPSTGSRPGSPTLKSSSKGKSENCHWERRAEDALVASLIHSERARREYERRAPPCNPDIDLAERHVEAALAYAKMSQSYVSSKTSKKVCGSVALALLAARNALGWGHAIRGDFKAAGIAFTQALAALDGCSHDKESGYSLDGTADILVFPVNTLRRDSLRCAMKRNIGIAARAGVGLGRFFATTQKVSQKNLRNAEELLTSAESEAAGCPCDAAVIHNHRGCVSHLLGSRKAALANFEEQMHLAKESGNVALEMDALRNLVDFHESRGDLQIALKYGKLRVRLAERCKNSIAIADASKRLASLYCAIGARHDFEEDEDGEKHRGPLDSAKLDSMHPAELDRHEKDVRWVERNYKVLARWSLQRYRKHAHAYLLPITEAE